MRRPKGGIDPTQEHRQRAADAYLDVAQGLEREAKILKERARHYRAGNLDTDYRDLPPEAGDHMKHPQQRAIDWCGISEYNIRALYEKVCTALKEPTP